MRGLAVIEPAAGLPLIRQIEQSALIPLLHSLEWTDRNKAAAVLFSITSTHRDPHTVAELRCDAVLPLAEMARWHSSAHAMAPFFILGRVAGLEESAIAAYWQDRDLASVLHAIDRSSQDCGTAD